MRGRGAVAAALAWLLLLMPQPSRAEVAGTLVSYRALPQETVFDIAHKFDIGVEALGAANPDINFMKDFAGRTVRIPSAHIVPPVKTGEIVINLAERRLYYRPQTGGLLTFPVAVGKEGWETRLGRTKIVAKREKPTWVPPVSLRLENPDLPPFVAPGPENPLGDFALNLGWEGVVIHGTNAPKSIGRSASHGCIRLYAEDIAQLFAAVKVGTPVRVVDMPYKVDVVQGRLYLEVSPVMAGTGWRQSTGTRAQADIYAAIRHAAGAQAQVDWQAVDAALARGDGMPVPVAVVADQISTVDR